MDITLFDQSAKKIGSVTLNKEVFGVAVNADTLHQAIVAQLANKRSPIAHTKDRSEVRGGGKKPWRQKGTGRARHGSIRSPLWTGGGVTFGPTNERNFSQKINKKMRTKALLMALSAKVSASDLVVLDALAAKEPKTKPMNVMLEHFLKHFGTAIKKENKLIMLVGDEQNASLYQSLRNIPFVSFSTADNLNVLDVVTYKHIIMTKKAIEQFEQRITHANA